MTIRATDRAVPDRIFNGIERDEVRILGPVVAFLSTAVGVADENTDWQRFVGRPTAARGGQGQTVNEQRIGRAHV